VRLKDTWQRYVIPLSTDYFDVYRDNHGAYFPSGFMGDAASLTLDESSTTTPRAGKLSKTQTAKLLAQRSTMTESHVDERHGCEGVHTDFGIGVSFPI